MIDLEVAVAAPLDQTLTYRLTDSSRSSTDKRNPEKYSGRRVLVPLGNRKITGYVLSQGPAADKVAYTVRPISRFLDEVPLFHGNIIPFFRWVADYYHYPIGLVIKSAMPAGLAPKTRKKIVIRKTIPDQAGASDPDQPDWLERLWRNHELSPQESTRLLADKDQKKVIESLVKTGDLAIETVLQSDGVREKRELCYSPLSGDYSPLAGHDDSREQLNHYKLLVEGATAKTIKLSEAKALYYLFTLFEQNNRQPVALKTLRKKYPGASKPLAALTAQQLILEEKKRVFRTPFGEQHRFYPRPERLTGEQQEVLDTLCPAIHSGKFSPFVLDRKSVV